MAEHEHNTRFTRCDIAKWYGICTSALRYRFAQKGIKITNRIFTISDVEYIIEKLGKPPFMPLGILHS